VMIPIRIKTVTDGAHQGDPSVCGKVEPNSGK